MGMGARDPRWNHHLSSFHYHHHFCFIVCVISKTVVVSGAFSVAVLCPEQLEGGDCVLAPSPATVCHGGEGTVAGLMSWLAESREYIHTYYILHKYTELSSLEFFRVQPGNVNSQCTGLPTQVRAVTIIVPFDMQVLWLTVSTSHCTLGVQYTGRFV